MVFSRIAAAICTCVLIAGCAFGCIALVASLGPRLAHGDEAAHVNGLLQPGANPQEVVLITSDGQRMSFRCEQRCLTQRAHIERHISERAPTDIYYLTDPGGFLIAIDVD